METKLLLCKTNMEWHAFLSSELSRSAYKAGNELAWPKEQALRIIDVLDAHGYIVDGVDVWVPTLPGPTIPTPFVYDWTLKKLPREDKIRQRQNNLLKVSHGILLTRAIMEYPLSSTSRP